MIVLYYIIILQIIFYRNTSNILTTSCRTNKIIELVLVLAE